MDNGLLRAYNLKEKRNIEKERLKSGANSVCPSCGHREAQTKGIPCKEQVCSKCGDALVEASELGVTEQGPEQLNALRTKATNNQKTQKPVGLADSAELTAPNLSPENTSLANFLPELQDIKTAIDNLIQRLFISEPDVLRLFATGEKVKANTALDEIASLWNQQIGAYRLWYENSGGKSSIAASPPAIQTIVAKFHEDIQMAAEKLAELHRVKNLNAKKSDGATEEKDKSAGINPVMTPEELEARKRELDARENELIKKEKQLLKDREDALDKREGRSLKKTGEPAKAPAKTA